MTIFDNYEVWFVIGSQHLYGPETLRQVTQHAEHVVNALNTEAKLPCKLVLKPLGTTPDEITAICRDANYDDRCAGLVVWLHTFSPAKMWINGLKGLQKPLLHLHTQANRDAYIDREWGPLAILEMTVEHLSGKEAIELVRQREGR